MKLTVDRRYKKPGYTIGCLLINGQYFCDTLEDAVRAVKIYGETAIPAGIYNVDMSTVSPKFRTRSWAVPWNGIVPRLLNVPNFQGVLIHPGNVPADTDGCILVGRNTAKGAVLQSQATYTQLMRNYLWPAKLRGEKIIIELY